MMEPRKNLRTLVLALMALTGIVAAPASAMAGDCGVGYARCLMGSSTYELQSGEDCYGDYVRCQMSLILTF